MLDPIATAAGYLLAPSYWLAVLAAVGLATIASVIPGVNSFLVMALAIPYIVINIRDPVIGLVLLATITGVDNTLDSIPAILYGQPGPATQVTFLEGHQLARQGYAARTLGAVYSVSALGGIIGAICLTIAIPVVRPLVLKFGFPEIAAMAMVGIAMVAILSRGAMTKGIIAALAGMLMASIGRDPFSGSSRLTIGPLFSLPLVPMALGLFALPEMIDLTINRLPVASSGAYVSRREVLIGAREGLRRWRMVIRQSLFGVFLGAIPGVGSAVIDWLAYAFGIFFAKDKTQFGKGSLEGVLFAESAQNAKEGGQAIPTLAVGIPGGPTWVFVLTGMIVYGVAPGPEMLGRNAHITILLVITLALGNVAITMLGILITGQLAKLTRVPYPIIGAVIIPTVLLSAFIDTLSWRGIQVVLALGAIGLLMKRYGWPRPPMLLGFILAPIVESQFQSALSVHGFWGIMQRPITLTILGVAVMTAVVSLRMAGRIERETMRVEETPGVAESGPAGRGPSLLVSRHLKLRWDWGLLLPLFLAVLGVLFFMDTFGYRNPRGAHFPRWLSLAMVLLSTLELYRQATGKARLASIMDLGMLSTDSPGTRRAAYAVAGLLTVFVLLSGTLGITTAAAVFAFLTPLMLLRGLGKWPLALLTAGLVYLFIFIVFNNVLFVIWPEPFLLRWLGLT